MSQPLPLLPVPPRPGAHAVAAAPVRSTAPADPLVTALRALAEEPRVREAQEALREATAGLRWHEALRRRWREARAEAAVRGAVASAAVEGAVVDAATLRGAVAGGGLAHALTGDPSLDAAAGLWRAGARLSGWWPDLRGDGRPAQPTATELLATLHRDVVGPLAAAGTVPVGEVATPRRGSVPPREGGPGPAPAGEGLEGRLQALLALVDVPGAPALVRAAVVHAETVCTRPFTAGNAALGRLLARHLLTRDGLEPTGVGVPDLYAARAPGAYAEALAGYATGGADGVVGWVRWQAEAVLVGVEEGLRVCRAVQAGTTAVG